MIVKFLFSNLDENVLLGILDKGNILFIIGEYNVFFFDKLFLICVCFWVLILFFLFFFLLIFKNYVIMKVKIIVVIVVIIVLLKLLFFCGLIYCGKLIIDGIINV